MPDETQPGEPTPKPATPIGEPLQAFDPRQLDPPGIGNVLIGPRVYLHTLELAHAGVLQNMGDDDFATFWHGFRKAVLYARCCIEGGCFVIEGGVTYPCRPCTLPLGERFKEGLVKPAADEATARAAIRDFIEWLPAGFFGLASGPDGRVIPPSRTPPPPGILARANELAAIGRRVQSIPPSGDALAPQVARRIAPTRPGPRETPPTDAEMRVVKILWNAPRGQGRTGTLLLNALEAAGTTGTTQGSLTSRIIPGLRTKGWDIPNTPGAGYHLSEDDRAAADRLFGKPPMPEH